MTREGPCSHFHAILYLDVIYFTFIWARQKYNRDIENEEGDSDGKHSFRCIGCGIVHVIDEDGIQSLMDCKLTGYKQTEE